MSIAMGPELEPEHTTRKVQHNVHSQGSSPEASKNVQVPEQEDDTLQH